MTTTLPKAMSECKCPLVCEILDPRTQKTIMANESLRGAAEFCQTNILTGKIVAMVSECRRVNSLFDELLCNRGCKISVYPVSRFAGVLELVSFWVLAKRASMSNIVLLGYQMKDCPDFVLNPVSKNEPRLWTDALLAGILREVPFEDMLDE